MKNLRGLILLTLILFAACVYVYTADCYTFKKCVAKSDKTDIAICDCANKSIFQVCY